MAKNNRNRSTNKNKIDKNIVKESVDNNVIDDFHNDDEIDENMNNGASAVTRSKPKNNLNDKKKLIIGLISALILLCLIIGGIIFAIVHNTHNNDKKSTSTSSSSTQSPEPKITTGKTGKTMEQDQKDAIAAAAKVLNDAAKNPKKLSEDDRLKKLDANDVSVVDKSLIDDMRFTNDTPDVFKSATYESVITLHSVLTKSTKGVLSNADNNYKSVYIDQQIGSAFVPLSNFSKGGSVFSMEMVNIDGKWKFAPYSLINEIKLSSVLSDQNSSMQSKLQSNN